MILYFHQCDEGMLVDLFPGFCRFNYTDTLSLAEFLRVANSRFSSDLTAWLIKG
ncbi:MAG: hypothetical protein HQM13_06135 [SAR324 cluster bacterium]|nr:hypothetical protein [SAR324 cluster bacterium]